MKEGYSKWYPVTMVIKNIKGYTYHWHNAISLYYIIDGELNFSTWTGEHKLKKDDLIILDNLTTHKFETISENNKVLILYIDDGYYKSLYENHKHIYIHYNSTLSKTNNKDKINNIKKLAKKLFCEILLNKNSVYSMAVEQSTNNILNALTEDADFISLGIKRKKIKDETMEIYRELFKLANKDFQSFQHVTLKEFSSYFGVGYEKLKKNITYTYGYSYNCIKNIMRREMAVVRLLSSEDSITEISYNCSFSDCKYFIACFKKAYGCTPYQFRTRYKKDGTQYRAEYYEYDIEDILKNNDCKNLEDLQSLKL